MPINEFPSFIFFEKEGDDWEENVDVSSLVTDLSGYSNFTCLGKDETALTTSVAASAAAFTASVSMVDISGSELLVTVDNTETVDLISEGDANAFYYADIQAENPSAKVKTLANLIFQVERDFTNG